MRPIATVDLTGMCPLRCRHCYYFAGDRVGELDGETMLARLAVARDAWGIRSVLRLGGEPLLRATLLIAFDTRVRPKRRCSYGDAEGCEACGCPIVGVQLARSLGDGASGALLRTLFLPASAATSS